MRVHTRWKMAMGLVAVSVVTESQAAPPVLQRGYDANVTGANLAETSLNTSNMGPDTFGHLFNLAVDDKIFAQPLYVPGVVVPGLGTHNVLYVATMNDSVYAFDADVGGAPLWSVNLAALFGTTAVSWADFAVDNGARGGNLGILSTPVIDPVTHYMYVVACTLEGGTMAYRLHALDITDGSEPYGPGVLVSASYAGASFTASHETQRVSLALAGSNVVFAFGAMEMESAGAYYGWVIEHDKTTLQPSGAFATIATGKNGGGVWQSGRPPAVDAFGYVYVFAGNGWGGGYDGVNDFSESVLKLDPSRGLELVDWFTPGNWSYLDANDLDLASSGPLLIPGPGGTTPLLAGGGKTGDLYILDTSNLGRFNANDSQVVQKENITAGGEIHGGPVFWNRSAAGGGPMLYNWGVSDVVKAFPFNGSALTATPSAEGTISANMPGGMLSLSANGEQPGSGLLWATTADTAPADGVLHVFDAGNTSNELWNSMLVPSRDSYGLYAKFVPPVVANGKAYVATFSKKVAVYGPIVTTPTYSLSPYSLAFGAQEVTSTSGVQLVSVTNAGGSAQPIASIAFSGTSASQFTQTNDCMPSIPAGSACTIDVMFAPAAPGLQAAYLTVKSGNSAGTRAIAVGGSGVAPFTLSPAALAFGNVAVNTQSAISPLTVTNTGAGPLPVTSIKLSGVNASQYSQANDCGSLLPVLSSCTINLTFKPTGLGNQTAFLRVESQNAAGQQTAALSGAGIEPFSLSPTALAFGSVALNTQSAASPVIVTNPGAAPLKLTGVKLLGVGAGQYAETDDCKPAVPAGGTCTINVVFAPTTSGSHKGSLKVSGPGSSLVTTLSGTGI